MSIEQKRHSRSVHKKTILLRKTSIYTSKYTEKSILGRLKITHERQTVKVLEDNL